MVLQDFLRNFTKTTHYRKTSTMDIKDFAQSLLDNVKDAVDTIGVDYEQELASSIIEYIVDNGEVNSPSICTFQKTRTRITAYDYNDEAESLDLFYLIKADSLVGRINNSRVQKGFNYLMEFYRLATTGTLFNNMEVSPSEEIVEVAKLVQSSKGKINQLRIYVITDGLVDPNAIPSAVESEDGSYIIEYNVWDIQRVFQQHNFRAGKEKVIIDFPTNYNTKLQCLKINEPNPYVDSYLAIIPGITLAKIYKQYLHALLEKNVRTFLQFKGKVNKQIRKTLREQPDMFFSYNNGISTTAREITLKQVGSTQYITSLYDWQIVNGGQTTASIAAALTDRNVDLRKVFVPMKVSVIRDVEHSDEIIKAISTSANSQTAIKNSDFSANEPFLVDLESFSRSEWIPRENKIPVSKWYFERTRGQYFDQLANLSGYNERAFRIEYPKSNKITKTDIAKYESAWNQTPFDVCKGAESNYTLYIKYIKREKPLVTAEYYRNIIAKCIIFNTIDALVKVKKLGGYKSNLNAYILSSISFLSNKKLDLKYIWEHQSVQIEVVKLIETLIPLVWNHIVGDATFESMTRNINDWTKKSECWEKLKSKLEEFGGFDEKLLEPERNDDGTSLNEVQLKRIEDANAFHAQFWFALADWARERDFLTPMDRKTAYNFGAKKQKNAKITTLKQALTALRIIEKAEELGFKK